MQPERARFPARGEVGDLAVHRDGRRHDDLANPATASDGILQEDPRTGGVHVTVAGDVVHRLPHAYERRAEHDYVDLVERQGDRTGVGERPTHELGARVQARRYMTLRSLNLGFEAVEAPHPMPPRDQG